MRLTVADLDAESARVRIKDIATMTIIEEITQCKNASEFQALEVELRNRAIKQFREKGLSIRQTSRLTEVSNGLVERATRR